MFPILRICLAVLIAAYFLFEGVIPLLRKRPAFPITRWMFENL